MRQSAARVAAQAADGFRDEEGFTTIGVVLALLIALSLLFSAAQVQRINSVAAEVQDVADAAALAAQNEVAEFMIVVRVCDAVALTMTLTGLVTTGLGVAALCTPYTAGASPGLLRAGKQILDARRHRQHDDRVHHGKSAQKGNQEHLGAQPSEPRHPELKTQRAERCNGHHRRHQNV